MASYYQVADKLHLLQSHRKTQCVQLGSYASASERRHGYFHEREESTRFYFLVQATISISSFSARVFSISYPPVILTSLPLSLPHVLYHHFLSSLTQNKKKSLTSKMHSLLKYTYVFLAIQLPLLVTSLSSHQQPPIDVLKGHTPIYLGDVFWPPSMMFLAWIPTEENRAEEWCRYSADASDEALFSLNGFEDLKIHDYFSEQG